ncbi:hypothetical protein VTN31DRAFT_1071 [Thermomyces dupontii]|uniref:uncharacterized protein n=1 Tax=Talaromyces thermophilus TaxID=28565 RepID=UPI0037427EFF
MPSSLKQASTLSNDNNSSDYGSDFSTDEEELLNDLLARVAASNTTFPPPTSTATAAVAATAVVESGSQAAVEENSSGSQATAVPDIEDYDPLHFSRVPKVLGRETWNSQQRWRQQQQRQINSTTLRRTAQRSDPVARDSSIPVILEHPNSTEGRIIDREKQREREIAWTSTIGNDEADAGSKAESEEVYQRSPLARFRTPPNKALSVSDLIAPAWCELQYWYTLTKHGRKRRTPAMKQGSAVHKVLEDEVHTTVPVEITTKEDGWALRIWNVIQGLRTLREFGMTRELEIWGVVEGEIVTGVIDQLSYVCPDRELEASAAEYYANARLARGALPEYQMSLTDYLLSPAAGGKRLRDLGLQEPERGSGLERYGYNPGWDIPRIYMTDVKTRGSRSIPSVSSSSFRPTHLQLHLYYHMLNRMVTSDDVTVELLAQRYGLDPERVFTDGFIAEVGGLNEQFFDAVSSQSSDPDYSSMSVTSQDSMTILLEHNNLTRLWKLMKNQLRRTFLPTSNIGNVAPSIPYHTQPEFLQQYPTVLSPVLTAKYLSAEPGETGVPEPLGSRSFLFDPVVLMDYLGDQMTWWRGEREPRGVEVMDAWKCRICEFREECEWRKDKEQELATRRRRRQSKTTATAIVG